MLIDERTGGRSLTRTNSPSMGDDAAAPEALPDPRGMGRGDGVGVVDAAPTTCRWAKG